MEREEQALVNTCAARALLPLPPLLSLLLEILTLSCGILSKTSHIMTSVPSADPLSSSHCLKSMLTARARS